jgi:hypothetical protein
MDGLHQLLSLTGYSPVRNAAVHCLGLNGTVHRPADVLIHDHSGRPTCIDGTCCSPLSAAKSTSKASSTLGFLCQDAHHQKIEKHDEDCSRAGYSFLPFACDVTGVLTPAASALLSRIASAYASRNDVLYGYALNIVRRKISFSIQLGVARQLTHLFHPRSVAWGDI